MKSVIKKITVFILIWCACILAGVLYSRYSSGGTLDSLVSNIFSEDALEGTASVDSPEVLKAKIEKLTLDISAEINDPDRAIELRRTRQRLIELLPSELPPGE